MTITRKIGGSGESYFVCDQHGELVYPECSKCESDNTIRTIVREEVEPLNRGLATILALLEQRLKPDLRLDLVAEGEPTRELHKRCGGSGEVKIKCHVTGNGHDIDCRCSSCYREILQPCPGCPDC